MKNPDGSYSPFSLESSISLLDLRNVIAERFDRHPRIVQLRYKLSNDKAKAPTTLIQNEDELQIFVERMRSLLVPQRLANGRVSKRAPKNIIVYFEDPTAEGKTADCSDGKGKKKASVRLPFVILSASMLTDESHYTHHLHRMSQYLMWHRAHQRQLQKNDKRQLANSRRDGAVNTIQRVQRKTYIVTWNRMGGASS